MHLTDGCGCKRLLLKVLHLVPPVWAEVAADDFLQRRSRDTVVSMKPTESVLFTSQLFILYHHLFSGHEIRTLSNTLEDFGQLGVDKDVI